MRNGLILAAILMPGAAAAQTAQGDVAVTIYNNNIALVQDSRTLTVPAGRSRQEFPDVSAQIRPETASLAGSGIAIVEQNFDYDLLSPDKLMEKAVGQMITIVRTNPATGAETREQARVLAANGGIVLQIGGRIEVLRDDGLPVRVVFDKVPSGPPYRVRSKARMTTNMPERSRPRYPCVENPATKRRASGAPSPRPAGSRPRWTRAAPAAADHAPCPIRPSMPPRRWRWPVQSQYASWLLPARPYSRTVQDAKFQIAPRRFQPL